MYATGEVFLKYSPKMVELRLDGEPAGVRYAILNIAIGNGRYHGGGMHVCPRARLDDGLLEVTVIEPGSVPLERVLGPEVGAIYAEIHRDEVSLAHR